LKEQEVLVKSQEHLFWFTAQSFLSVFVLLIRPPQRYNRWLNIKRFGFIG